MDKDTRNRIQHATQAARKLLEGEFAAQLEGSFDIRPDGTVAVEPGRHLAEDTDALRVRAKLVEAVAHHRALGEKPADAVKSVLRASAFTTLNRFVALKMLEARKIVQECVTKGLESSGFKNEFLGLADGLKVQPDAAYKLYLECLFDEIGREVRVLFDRRDPASLLWPRRTALEELLGIVNDPELAAVWGEDETIGWVYQYFNGEDERRQMRAESQAPRNSRELAVRNQFFTPRYVVEFLTDNTLGRTWVEMQRGETRLMEQCRYLVRRPSEVFLRQGEVAPPEDEGVPVEQRTVYVPFRAKKDPREIRVLDPACGSGHFLLYSFDLLLAIYEEAWADAELGPELWRAVGFRPDVVSDDAGVPVVPASVRLIPGAAAHCFSCGCSGPVAEARFILARYNPGHVAGRPMTYCARCAEEKHHAISVDMPLSEFSLARALNAGWFAHVTAGYFVELANVFTFERGGDWTHVLEQVNAARQPEAIAKLHHVLPGWILRHNLHGVDIDPRAAQIAAMALWMRAQRAWNDFGVRRADRPLVTRTNVVVAEPMPGERDLLEEFCRSLVPEVAGLVRQVFEDMQLAGEAGTLLRIEETVREELRKRFGRGGLFAKQDAEQWADVEQQVYEALRGYAEQVPGGAGYRRRLFAEDAARGFAFIDVSRKRYDVVLMNPPFGAGSMLAKAMIGSAWPRSKNDLYAAFVERGIGLMPEAGMLGAITSRTGFFLSGFQKWREEVLLQEAPPTVFADLGAGVLDSAMVETAAYCLRRAS